MSTFGKLNSFRAQAQGQDVPGAVSELTDALLREATGKDDVSKATELDISEARFQLTAPDSMKLIKDGSLKRIDCSRNKVRARGLASRHQLPHTHLSSPILNFRDSPHS